MRTDLIIWGIAIYIFSMFFASILSVWESTSDADRFEVISHNEEKLLIFDKKTGDYRTEKLEIPKSE